MTVDSEQWVDRIEELSAVAERAETALRELRSELKEARRVTHEMDEARRTLLAAVVDERIAEAVQVGLDDYKGTLQQAIADATRKIEHEFDRLFTSYMKGSRTSGADLRDLLGGE